MPNYLKAYREAHGLSVGELCEVLNLSYSYIYKLMETDINGEPLMRPGKHAVSTISKITGISVGKLLGIKED
jgi:transcriptional regulator with XRE-family HTH domain